MVIKKLNEDGFIERYTSKHVVRDWYVPVFNKNNNLIVRLGYVKLPLKYAGKRVRFKIEVVD